MKYRLEHQSIKEFFHTGHTHSHAHIDIENIYILSFIKTGIYENLKQARNVKSLYLIRTTFDIHTQGDVLLGILIARISDK
ncbi:MAG: hypothetical protein WC313_00880 [Candidatus Kapaibacterium sp.]